MGKLSLKDVVAMGIGGIIGGGIFAVLGVATKLSGNAAFITYFLAGCIAMASGYSYYLMTDKVRESGGSFTFLEHYIEESNFAGVVGWTLVLGYIGTMAMYAHAFGSFGAEILGLSPGSFMRALISLGIIGLLLGINFLGTSETGSSETLMVSLKVIILLLFCLAGLGGVFFSKDISFLPGGVFNKGFISPLTAIGAIFVSFEGFQLLTYEFTEIEGGIENLKKGIIISIAVSTAIYILTALVTTSLLTPAEIVQHKETVLAFAASKIFASNAVNYISGLLVSVAALFSTASAINATLFGTARLMHKMATDKELPNLFSFRNSKGVPTYSLVVLGVLTATFTFFGSLEEITTFASLSFIMVFSVVNILGFYESRNLFQKTVTGLGSLGTTVSFLLLTWHLYLDKIHVLLFVVAIFTGLILLETAYFERNHIAEEIKEIEQQV